MKKDLDVTLMEASRRLEAGASSQDLQAAAALLVEAIDVNLRPSARAMWQETVPEESPIRIVTLLVDTIAQWRLPLRTILAFFLIVVGLGSVIRSGIIDGGEYTVRYLVITGLILGVSTSLARVIPRRAPVIAMVTLVMLPPLILLGDHWIGSRLLGLPVDPAGQIVVALQTPVTTVFIAMAIEAVRARDEVLSALQARINAEVALLHQQKGRSRGDAQRLSLFVHHSVQSELSAIAMRASEAALGHDVATMDTVSYEARERIGHLASLDAHSAPWKQSARGREHIDTVVQAWTGLLSIDLELTEESACRADQWQLAARVVEEALANAARHSGASTIAITGHYERSALVLEVIDDGRRDSDPSVPGLGTWWLDRIAPGEWSLEHGDQGSTLTVRIR
jgi:two-component sensor histidine kinase